MTLATRRTSPAGATSAPSPSPTASPALMRGGPARYDRQPAGDPIPYRGYLIAPMTETLLNGDRGAGNPTVRTRWDILETLQIPDRPPLITRRKTCASRITAEGWIDAFGEVPAGAADSAPPAHDAP